MPCEAFGGQSYSGVEEQQSLRFVLPGTESRGRAVSLGSPVDSEHISQVYDQIQTDFYAERSNPKGLFRTFLWPVLSQNIGEVVGKKVLDVGCGPGVVSNMLASNHETEVIGIDISPRMLNTARTHFGNKAEFMLANVCNIPLKSESIDKVVVSYVFNHLDTEGLQVALSEIHRVLKKGGKVTIMEPHPDRNQKYYEDAGGRGRYPEGWYGETFPESNNLDVPCYYRHMETWIKCFDSSPYKRKHLYAPTTENTWVPNLSKKAEQHYSLKRIFIANLIK